MSAKAVLIICAQALFVQGIVSQCAGIPGLPLAVEEYGAGLALGPGFGAFGATPLAYGPPGFAAPGYGLNVAPSSGGGFAVTSVSPISPTGITVVSENAIEGVLSAVGELPFLSAVAFEGALPTGGAGGINYGCGNGAVGIVSEGLAPAPAAYPGSLGYAAPGLSGPYGAGIGGVGYGARGFSLGCGAAY